jgi:glycosidase
LIYDDNVYVFARQDATETIIIAFNRQDRERELTIPFNSIVPIIGKIRVSSGQTTITLPATSAVAFKAT